MHVPDAARRAQAFAGGWFHTGDQGFLDGDGFLTLTGRIKELINRGGEKISPLEVREGSAWQCWLVATVLLQRAVSMVSSDEPVMNLILHPVNAGDASADLRKTAPHRGCHERRQAPVARPGQICRH